MQRKATAIVPRDHLNLSQVLENGNHAFACPPHHAIYTILGSTQIAERIRDQDHLD